MFDLIGSQIHALSHKSRACSRSCSSLSSLQIHLSKESILRSWINILDSCNVRRVSIVLTSEHISKSSRDTSRTASHTGPASLHRRSHQCWSFLLSCSEKELESNRTDWKRVDIEIGSQPTFLLIRFVLTKLRVSSTVLETEQGPSTKW